MDILGIRPNVRTLVVLHPATREPVGLEIDYRSLDSEEVQKVERQLRNKSLRGGRNNVTVDKLDDSEYAILTAAIADWRWSKGLKLGDDGHPVLNRSNVEKLFKSALWIKKQLDDEMKDESGFFTESEKNSEIKSSTL